MGNSNCSGLCGGHMFAIYDTGGTVMLLFSCVLTHSIASKRVTQIFEHCSFYCHERDKRTSCLSNPAIRINKFGKSLLPKTSNRIMLIELASHCIWNTPKSHGHSSNCIKQSCGPEAVHSRSKCSEIKYYQYSYGYIGITGENNQLLL